MSWREECFLKTLQLEIFSERISFIGGGGFRAHGATETLARNLEQML
jgi:hypothetical protein